MRSTRRELVAETVAALLEEDNDPICRPPWRINVGAEEARAERRMDEHVVVELPRL